MSAGTPPDLELLREAGPAAALLHPLRARILAEARDPDSAAGIAARLGLPRQRVNYHVRELHRAGLLKRVGRRRKRNLDERLFQASACAYLLSPELAGALCPDPEDLPRGDGAVYLLALLARSLGELGRLARGAPSLALEADLRFESAAQRGRFAAALEEAVRRVVREHSAPTESTLETAGELYRLVLGCHPSTPIEGAPS